MPRAEWPYWTAVLLAYALTAVSQIVLKVAAGRSGRVSIRTWMNPLVLAAYATFLVVTLLSLFAFKVVPLRATVVLAPLTLLCVTFASILFFRERLSRAQMCGIALIAAGVLLFNLG